MRWPIRNQIFVPFALLLMAAVGSIAIAASLLSVKRNGELRVAQIRRVVETLGDATFPYNETVLQKMRGLSEADFVALGIDGKTVASTLDVDPIELTPLADVDSNSKIETLSSLPVVEVASQRYFVATVDGSGRDGVARLLVLYPEQTWQQSQWDAAWPPLLVGMVTLTVMLFFSGALSQRIGRRIRLLQELLARLAIGDFGQVSLTGPKDELFQLVESANTLSGQLSVMRQQICHTERLRLLAQLAGGLAHQLRNAVTGAKMAVQLHQRRCPGLERDNSINVALQQLRLTEEQIKSLLSLAKPGRRDTAVTRTLGSVLDDIGNLVHPACEHARVQFRPPRLNSVLAAHPLQNAEETQAALLNLVLNAIEAAGVEGTVWINVEQSATLLFIRVADSGPGPPPDSSDTIFEPFASSKAEGVGLGLTLARSAARTQGGDLTWHREQGRTVFTFVLPLESRAAHVSAIGQGNSE